MISLWINISGGGGGGDEILLGSFFRENALGRGGGKFSFQNPLFGLIRFEEEALCLRCKCSPD